MNRLCSFLLAAFVTACGPGPGPAKSGTRYIATNATGVTYLYWARDTTLFRGRCDDGEHIMNLCQHDVQSVDWNYFKALLADGALNYELVTIRVEDLVTFMVDFKSPAFPELKTDLARFDELFRKALEASVQ